MHSKWPEVFSIKSQTSAQTIECLRAVFARWGLPLQLVSDNAQTFASEEFAEFMSVNGVKHTTSAPFHPATNGLAERFVQTLKQGLRASTRDGGTLQTRLSQFLAAYRNTPHITTVLMLQRRPRTRLDLMKPSKQDNVLNKQAKMLYGARERQVTTGQEVLVRDYRRAGKWAYGIVQAQAGPRSYEVHVGPNMVWRRHIDQMHSAGPGVRGQQEEGRATGSSSG